MQSESIDYSVLDKDLQKEVRQAFETLAWLKRKTEETEVQDADRIKV